LLFLGAEEYHRYGSTAFHTAASGAEVSAKRYRYTGKEKDEETGLYYHGARYYAAWLGRWTAVDPSGVAGGLNLYEYGSSNPIVFNDPNGRAPRNADGSLNDEDPGVKLRRGQGLSEARIQRLLDIDPSRKEARSGGGRA